MKVPPFNAYYPNVDEMSPDQRRFYEGFRRALENGEFVEIEEQISYVFCYAYEAINLGSPRKSHRVLTQLAKLYEDNPKLPDYLNSWAAHCAILLGELDQALKLLPEPKLGATWGLVANTRLSLKHALKLLPAPRELVAIVGPKVTKYGRENLESVEKYLGVRI